MNYTHTITTSLESNYENDDDVIELLTCLYRNRKLFSAKIKDNLIRKQLKI
jgi:hypothetical protein